MLWKSLLLPVHLSWTLCFKKFIAYTQPCTIPSPSMCIKSGRKAIRNTFPSAAKVTNIDSGITSILYVTCSFYGCSHLGICGFYNFGVIEAEREKEQSWRHCALACWTLRVVNLVFKVSSKLSKVWLAPCTLFCGLNTKLTCTCISKSFFLTYTSYGLCEAFSTSLIYSTKCVGVTAY